MNGYDKNILFNEMDKNMLIMQELLTNECFVWRCDLVGDDLPFGVMTDLLTRKHTCRLQAHTHIQTTREVKMPYADIKLLNSHGPSDAYMRK